MNSAYAGYRRHLAAGAGETCWFCNSGIHRSSKCDCGILADHIKTLRTEYHERDAEEFPETAETVPTIHGSAFAVASDMFVRIQAFQYVDAFKTNPPKPTQPTVNVGIYAKACAEEFVSAWIAGTLKAG